MTQIFGYQKRPDQICPTVNFAFSRDGHFGLGRGGGVRGGGYVGGTPPPPPAVYFPGHRGPCHGGGPSSTYTSAQACGRYIPPPASPPLIKPTLHLPRSRPRGEQGGTGPRRPRKRTGPRGGGYPWPNEPSAPHAPPCEPATEPSDRDIPTVSTEEELGGLASSLQTPSVLYCVPPAPRAHATPSAGRRGCRDRIRDQLQVGPDLCSCGKSIPCLHATVPHTSGRTWPQRRLLHPPIGD